MKKLVLMFAAIAAVSLASCGGNKTADAEKATTDVATEAPAAADAAATTADTTVVDTTKTVAE